MTTTDTETQRILLVSSNKWSRVNTTLTRGNRQVEWENIGEGWSGDYNSDDPDDVNLLRFHVLELNGEGEWEDMEDASYCTRMPADTPDNGLRRAAKIIMGQTWGESNIKKICEHLSWISPDDLIEE
tara:strand:+ start:2184 stop:2564 length:381 start_codon:yes stop_codon:yes gene_type:complete